MSHRLTLRTAALVFAPLLLLASCASGDDGNGATSDTTTAGQERPRPEGPVADLSEELTGGEGIFLASPTGFDVESAGWVEHEYVAAGTASSYQGELPADGMASLTPAEQAEYRTRIVVRRPAEAADFNGTVVVEWLNVSGGLDANPDFAFLADELARQGTAWVGVSAQLIGVEGGDVAVSAGSAGEGLAGKGLKGIDPARYGSLGHPGDAFAYDIYTQVGRALRADDAAGVMGDLQVENVLAIGESQSAFALTTYVDGVHPLTEVYDGYLIHSRGGSGLPLGEPGKAMSITDAVVSGKPVTIRTDVDVPVLALETETDVLSVLNYFPARQPDSEHFRLWEVAGTAHADRSLVGALADDLECGVEINDGPQRFVVAAAYRALDNWVRTGAAPPEAPRLEVDESSGEPAFRRDEDGIVLGGIRLPQVEVPVATLSGDEGPAGGVICLLMGSTIPFAPERLAARYPSRDDYLAAYESATDEAIAAGFALQDDRQAILDDAEPSVIPG